MVRKRVDVSDYDRTRRGRPEHVREYSREQDVREQAGDPSLAPLKRRRSRSQKPAVQARAPHIRELKGSVKALDEIAKAWDDTIKRELGPDYEGVLRDYDWEDPESRPIITGDLRDTTNFVILGPDGAPVATTAVLFENEIASQEDDSGEEEMDEDLREELAGKSQDEKDYDAYMRVWEEYAEAGFFDDGIFRIKERDPGTLIGASAYQFSESYEHGGRETGHNEFLGLAGPDAEAQAEAIARKLGEMGYATDTFAPFDEKVKRGIRITGGKGKGAR